MANRHQHQFRTNKILLPATDSRELSEYGEEGAGSAGVAAGKQPKRAKVTAVACQPCQKRKSKCDGLRPMCSSCQQKGRNDCVYDSTSDLRRTSALKQTIDNLKQEVTDLKDILLALCTAYGAGTSDDFLALLQQNISQDNFSRIPELAQVLRTSTNLDSSSPTQTTHGGFGGRQITPFGPFQQLPQGMGINYQGMMQDGAQQSSATDGQHDWSADGVSHSADNTPDQYPPGYMYRP